MTSGYFPGGYGGSYDDLFGGYAGGGPRQPRRIDITQLLTERARELVNTAARRAAETGSSDLDTDHLLWAMTRVTVREAPWTSRWSRRGNPPGPVRPDRRGDSPHRRAAPAAA